MKKTLSILLLIMVCIVSIPAFADTSKDSEPTVILSGSGVYVPPEVIAQLLRENPDAESIVVTAWHAKALPPQVDTRSMATSGVDYWVYESYTKNTAQTNAILKDLHVITCATGVQKTLSSTFTETFSSSVTLSSSFGDEDIPVASASQLGIEGSVTVEISQTAVFTGPPADKTNVNSREYRVQWYGNIGSWSGVVRNITTNETKNVYGNWTEYVGATEYYIDRYIEPLQ